jgi:hypothetical protein
MATLKPINKYQLYVSSHPQFNEWQANVLLRQDNALIADVRFVAQPENWASRGSINPSGVSLIYVGIERYPWFVDILRNEKPLFAVLYPASATEPPRLLLQTAPEPIGETEGALT